MPPGPLTVGYAVEACWEPPSIMPVTDPANDFPYSANQSEAYHFKLTVNNNEPITSSCCYTTEDCQQWSQVTLEYAVWYGPLVPKTIDVSPGVLPLTNWGPLTSCADNPELLTPLGYNFSDYPEGDYRGVIAAKNQNPAGFKLPPVDVVYTIFDYTVNIK